MMLVVMITMAMMATCSGKSVDRPPGGCGSIGDGGVGYGQDECKFHNSKIVIIFLDLLMMWFSTSLDNFLGFVINSSSSCKNYALAQRRVLLTHNQFCLFDMFSTSCQKNAKKNQKTFIGRFIKAELVGANTVHGPAVR